MASNLKMKRKMNALPRAGWAKGGPRSADTVTNTRTVAPTCPNQQGRLAESSPDSPRNFTPATPSVA